MNSRINTSDLLNAIPSWASPESIIVNDQVIGEICDTIRVGILNVSTFSKDETSHQVKGINPDMTAIGEAKRQITPNKSNSRLIPPHDDPRVQLIFPVETNFTAEEVSINTKGLETSGENIRKPENWAKHLDQELKKELRKIIIKKVGIPNRKLLMHDLAEIISIFLGTAIIFYFSNDKKDRVYPIILASIFIPAIVLMPVFTLCISTIYGKIIKKYIFSVMMEKTSLLQSGELHYLPKDIISLTGVEPIKLAAALYKLYSNQLIGVESNQTKSITE